MDTKNPVISLITPGRRAIGEKWSKVNIFADDSTGGYKVKREDTPAPAGNRPIVVPGLGNISIEMADFILEKQRHDQEEQVKEGRFDHSVDMENRIKQLWMEYMEWKVKMLEGKTVSGPYSWSQRERVNR